MGEKTEGKTTGNTAGNTAGGKGEPIIRLAGLGKQFKTAGGVVTALEDINLEINHGEIFGIIGLSGAGKSTLVRCINYLEVPTSGAVVFEGVNLAGKNEKVIRKARQSMGMIFQQFNLLAQRNVLQNVCFPMELVKVPKKRRRGVRRSFWSWWVFRTG